MDMYALQRFAPPAGTILVISMASSAQWLFSRIEPGPLRKGDAYIFNALVTCQLICFWRLCGTDPGHIPKDWQQPLDTMKDASASPSDVVPRRRWCRRCEAPKPPRSHHCKTCKRCIAKMDHHCVWTANCVSHITFPHFIRFLIYGVAAMIFLEYSLYQRCAVLWYKRHLPSYLGPSVFQFSLLVVLVVLNSFLLFMLGILLGRTIWSTALNITTIESWEIERHEALLRRARALGGYLIGPNGHKIRIERQEFPWDIGIWKNVCQAFGSRNPFAWLWPLAASPSVESGLAFEHNGIEDPNKPWPPPDPDRVYRSPPKPSLRNGFTQAMDVESFQQRQLADYARYTDVDGEYVVRRRPFHERLGAMNQADITEVGNTAEVGSEHGEDGSSSESDVQHDENDLKEEGGEEAWRNREGERLKDFGVDEVVEFYDEDDDLPLTELLRKRKAGQ